MRPRSPGSSPSATQCRANPGDGQSLRNFFIYRLIYTKFVTHGTWPWTTAQRFSAELNKFQIFAIRGPLTRGGGGAALPAGHPAARLNADTAFPDYTVLSRSPSNLACTSPWGPPSDFETNSTSLNFSPAGSWEKGQVRTLSPRGLPASSQPPPGRYRGKGLVRETFSVHGRFGPNFNLHVTWDHERLSTNFEQNHTGLESSRSGLARDKRPIWSNLASTTPVSQCYCPAMLKRIQHVWISSALYRHV